MPDPLLDSFQELEAVWEQWTGGALYLVNRHRSAHRSAIPEELLDVLDGPFQPDGQSRADAHWWVCPVAGQLSLVASATQDTPFSRVLPSWAALLRLQMQPSAVEAVQESAVWRKLAERVCGAAGLEAAMQAAVDVFQEEDPTADWFLVYEQAGSLQSAGTREFSAAELLDRAVRRSSGRSERVSGYEHSSPISTIALDVAPPSRMWLMIDDTDAPAQNEVEWRRDLREMMSLVMRPLVALELDALQQRVTHELALAAEIQSSLFPVSMPAIPGFDLAADLLPARQVGGDFFDLSRSKNGKVVLAVGDVAGKGASASILTAVAHALLHSASIHHDQPAALLETINARMYADLDRAETFITLVLVFLDPERREIQVASAGHVDAMLWRSRTEALELLPATGLPLGIYPSTTYTSMEMTIEPGDVLCLYTDGITEAEGPDGKLLGVQGLADLLYACHLAPSRSQVDVVLTALEVHRRGVLQRDDVALLLCRCEGEELKPRMVLPFVVAAEPASIRSIVDLVRNLAEEAAPTFTMLEREPVEDFALALAEVVTNQIKHAYRQEGGRIQGRLVLDKNTLSADTFDYGHSFHPIVPEGNLDPENPPEGGFGMQLIDALTDEWRYTPLEGGRNHWHLQKHIAGTR